VSQDNVIKMARQVKVCDTPAGGLRRFCFNTGFGCHTGDEFWHPTLPAGTVPDSKRLELAPLVGTNSRSLAAAAADRGAPSLASSGSSKTRPSQNSANGTPIPISGMAGIVPSRETWPIPSPPARVKTVAAIQSCSRT
jgi:hypothetical protein